MISGRGLSRVGYRVSTCSGYLRKSIVRGARVVGSHRRAHAVDCSHDHCLRVAVANSRREAPRALWVAIITKLGLMTQRLPLGENVGVTAEGRAWGIRRVKGETVLEVVSVARSHETLLVVSHQGRTSVW